MGEGERGGENKGVGIIWNVAYSAGWGGYRATDLCSILQSSPFTIFNLGT